MAASKDTSSTEKLLRAIKGKRGKDSAPAAPRAAKAPVRTPRKGAPPVIGVDIAPDSLRLVKIVMADGAPRLSGYWSVPYDEDGGPKSPDFARFLAAKVGEFKGSDRKAELWSLVSSAQAEMFHVRIPKVPRSQISETVYWTAQKEKAFNEGEYTMDYEVQGEVMDQGVSKIQVLVYMVPREVVQKRKELFAAAGVKLTGLTISPIALQSLFRSELVTENGESCANIYIGRNWSRIDVFAKGDLVLSRGVNTGTSSLVSALAEAYEERRVCAADETPQIPEPQPGPAPMDIDAGLEIVLELDDDVAEAEAEPAPQEDAEGIPVLEIEGDGSSGFELEVDSLPEPTPPEAEAEPEPKVEDEFADACRPVGDEPITEEQAKAVLLAKLLGRQLEPGHPGGELSPEDVVNLAGTAVSRLVRQIERTFDHHINTLGGDSIQKIFFSGDICTNAYFLDVLSRQLHIPCSLLDPLGVLGRGADAPRVPDTSAERLAYNLVCGLALCSPEHTPNLLNTYKAKDQVYQVRRQGNIVYGVFLGIVLTMAGFWLWQQQVTLGLQAELDQEQAKVAGFNPKVDENVLLGMATKAGQQQRQLKLLSGKYEGLAAINEVGRLTPETIRLTSMGLEFGEPEGVGKTKARTAANTEPVRILVLDGRVEGQPAMFDAVLATYLAKLNNSPLFTAPVVFKREVEQDKSKGDVLRFIIHISVV